LTHTVCIDTTCMAGDW